MIDVPVLVVGGGPAGILTLHERRTDLIISGEVNRYPAEIEGTLA